MSPNYAPTLDAAVEPAGNMDPVKAYFSDIGNIPLLKPHEQRQLGAELSRLRHHMDFMICGLDPLAYVIAAMYEGRKSSGNSRNGKGSNTLNEKITDIIDARNAGLNPDDLDRFFGYVSGLEIEFARELYEDTETHLAAAGNDNGASRKFFQNLDSIIGKGVSSLNLFGYIHRVDSLNPSTRIEIRGLFSWLIEEYQAAISKEDTETIKSLEELTGISPADLGRYKRAFDLTHESYVLLMNKITEHNLRLVVPIARKYRTDGLDLLDLIQYGNIGLMRAAEAFNGAIGYKFGTYATGWIKQGITRGLQNHSTPIRLPVHKRAEVSKVLRAASGLGIDLTHITHDQKNRIANITRMSAEQVEGVLINSGVAVTVSSSSPIGNDSEDPLSDFFGAEDPGFEEAEQESVRDNISVLLRASLGILTPRQRKVLTSIFGLNGGRPKTLDEVGDELGVTRQNIWLIKKRALKKLGRKLNPGDFDYA